MIGTSQGWKMSFHSELVIFRVNKFIYRVTDIDVEPTLIMILSGNTFSTCENPRKQMKLPKFYGNRRL